MLPIRKTRNKQNLQRFSSWKIQWPALCQIVFKLDYLHHHKTPSETPTLGNKL
ncbi:hypothetical protein BDF20DRAFT_891915, partial [Mycotypha africana]|uniref:uncharacterized protein n=1 Tax=Mycotypha africana TaxID=64632 RepID=UPI002301380E